MTPRPQMPRNLQSPDVPAGPEMPEEMKAEYDEATFPMRQEQAIGELALRAWAILVEKGADPTTATEKAYRHAECFIKEKGQRLRDIGQKHGAALKALDSKWQAIVKAHAEQTEGGSYAAPDSATVEGG